jgi:hypothetical protein
VRPRDHFPWSRYPPGRLPEVSVPWVSNRVVTDFEQECRFIRGVYLAVLGDGPTQARYRLGILARLLEPMPFP